jgi:hypothetical protein
LTEGERRIAGRIAKSDDAAEASFNRVLAEIYPDPATWPEYGLGLWWHCWIVMARARRGVFRAA